jgi:hypothetical protein
MNKDIAATVTGLVTGICGILAIFNIVIPQEISGVIASIGVIILGYITNKGTAWSMGAITAILGIASSGLSLFDQYINDPVRRLEAKQKYLDALKEKAKDALNAKDMEVLDSLILEFITSIHNVK